MGFVAVALRTANSILQTAATAGRLGPRLAPGSAAGGPWWLPNGSQALLNFVSSILSREFCSCAVYRRGPGRFKLCVI